eukprot:PhF_6_TR38660/c0_g1_i1/m.57780
MFRMLRLLIIATLLHRSWGYADTYSSVGNYWSGGAPVVGLRIDDYTTSGATTQGFGGYVYYNWVWAEQAAYHGFVQTYVRMKTGWKNGVDQSSLNCASYTGNSAFLVGQWAIRKSQYISTTYYQVTGYVVYTTTSKTTMSCQATFVKLDFHNDLTSYTAAELQWGFQLNWYGLSCCYDDFLGRLNSDHIVNGQGGTYVSDLDSSSLSDPTDQTSFGAGWKIEITCYADWTRGYWSGDRCLECHRGFATSLCTKTCPGLRGAIGSSLTNSPICSGNGRCDQGIYGTSQCWCQFGYFGIDCSWEFLAVGDALGSPITQYQLILTDQIQGGAYTLATHKWIGTYYGTTSYHRVRVNSKHYNSNAVWRTMMEANKNSLFVLSTQAAAVTCATQQTSPTIPVPLVIYTSGTPAYNKNSFPYVYENSAVVFLKFDTTLTNLALNANGHYAGVCRCRINNVAGGSIEQNINAC